MLQMKPARARVEKETVQKVLPDDDAPEDDPDLDATRKSIVVQEA